MYSTERFNGVAKEYSLGRPDYAIGLINLLFQQYGFSDSSIVADIGSGTGKFAKQLLDRGCSVIGVEPNDDMRCFAEKELYDYLKFESIAGNAENTMLADKSVDFITTAQAFHWFDTIRFKEECSRILKTDGKVFLIWNVRNEQSLINQELCRLYSEYCPEFKGFSGGIKIHDERIKRFFDDDYEFFCFDNPLYFDRQKFINRSLSGSYSLKKGDPSFDVYTEKINDIFDEFEKGGNVIVENQTIVYAGTLQR